MNDLKRSLVTAGIDPLHFLLQKRLQSRLPNLRDHDRRAGGEPSLAHGEYDFVSQIAVEGLQLLNQIGEFRPLAALLLLPPIAQCRTLLQRYLKELAGLTESGREVGNGSIIAV